jgi:hypothetical protein
MRILTENELLDISKLYTKEVLVPERGEDCGVVIKKLDAGDVVRIQETVKDGKASLDYYCSLISLSVVNDKNKTFLKNEVVAKWNPGEFNRILLEVLDFNGMNPEKVAEARAQLKN